MDTKKVKSSNVLSQFIQEVVYLIQNWRFTAPFVVNQCGSILYMRMLGLVELTLLVPVVNSLTFLFTTVVGHLLGENINKGVVCGSCLIMCGVTFCVITKIA